MLGKTLIDFINLRAKGKLKAKPSKKTGTIFKCYMHSWLETVKKPFIKDVSYADYYNAFKYYIEPALKGKTLEELKPIDIQVFWIHILSSVKIKKRKSYISFYVNTSIAALSMVWLLFPYEKVTLPHYDQEHGVYALNSCINAVFLVRGDGDRAFNDAPRSDVINVVLCHQVFYNSSLLW